MSPVFTIQLYNSYVVFSYHDWYFVLHSLMGDQGYITEQSPVCIQQCLQTDWNSVPNTHTTVYGPSSRTAWVSRYQKKHSPTHAYPGQPSFISFCLLWSIAFSLFNLCACSEYFLTACMMCINSQYTRFCLQLFLLCTYDCNWVKTNFSSNIVIERKL